MKRFKDSKALLDKRRFKKLEEEKKQWLKNLSYKKALQIEESLLSSELIWEWRKNFSEDHPVCLKMSLSTRQKT
ncbi:MAG: hypothetical protein ACE5NM_06085 [Sedimentisphaerales bacterium]